MPTRLFIVLNLHPGINVFMHEKDIGQRVFCIRNEGYGYKNVDCLYPNRLVHKYIYARIEINQYHINFNLVRHHLW